MEKSAIIYTEGKTDIKYLKKAQEKLNIQLNLEYEQLKTYSGDTSLITICNSLSQTSNNLTPTIFVFDRDNNDTIKKVMEIGKKFKNWGNSVYSFAIPIPENRKNHENISIEFFFIDSEIKTLDRNGRRLYLSSEFIEGSGKLKTDPTISLGNKNKIKNYCSPQKAKIIDDEVFNSENKNIALSKEDFVNYIFNDEPPFDKMNYDQFIIIFNIIKTILEFHFNENIKVPIIMSKNRAMKDHPPNVSMFVGREDYINKIVDPNMRVVAITGLGGEGKSALAAKIYEMSMNHKTNINFRKFGWCDFKELETSIHEKILGLIEDLTSGVETKQKYCDENIRDTFSRLINFLNNNNTLVVLDNVDAFVDKDVFSLTGPIKHYLMR